VTGLELADRIAAHDWETVDVATICCRRCGHRVTEDNLDDTIPAGCVQFRPRRPRHPEPDVWVQPSDGGHQRPASLGPLPLLPGWRAEDLPVDIPHDADAWPCPSIGCGGDHAWALLTGPSSHRVIYCPSKEHRS
jgi:hypothetical protein